MAKRLRHTALVCAVVCGLATELSAQQPPQNMPLLPGAAVQNAGPQAGNQMLLAPPVMSPPSLAEQQADPAQLKVYEVPSELIGAVGARLQITYHGHPRVRVDTEPKTGQLMILAPESIQKDIGVKMQMLIFEARKSGLVTDDKGMSVASTKQQSYALKNLRAQDLENALHRLAGPRLTTTTERNGEVVVFRLASTTGMQDVLQVDRTAGYVTLLGGGASVAGWLQIIYALDMGQSDPHNATHVMPLAPADPYRVRQAVQLVRAAYQQDDNQQVTAQVPAGQNPPRQPRQPQPGEPANPDDPAMAIGSTDTLGADTGLFGDVQIEFIEDLDLVIIKGAKRDVQRTLEVIDQIKKKSIETQPAIEVLQLKHVDSQAVATLIDELYDEVLKPRQGAVSITSLGQPNALLLIGRKEAVDSVITLIRKLDQPLDPSNQLRVFRLLHASAVDAESTIRDFFAESPGGAANSGTRAGLGTRVKLIADYRTNSLIIQAAPRDMSEVAKLIEQIDVEGTTARNEVRIFRLKNTTATAVRTVLDGVISGEGGGGTPQQGGGGGGGGGGGANGSASPPSTSISIATSSGRVDSGILAGVVITADEAQNSLVVRAPSKSMALIGELIMELDKLPDAEAQIKVFPIRNGSASTLGGLIQQLFGLPVTAGQGNAAGGLFGGLNNQLTLAGLTGGGEGSLVQLRVTVDTRTNSIIVSGAASDLEVIEVLLTRLDEESVEPRTNEVFWLRNANAQDVATALSGFLNTQRQFIQQQLFLSNAISIIEQVDREIFIVAEPTTNSLIVSATPRYFESIRKVIAKLDRRPPLVAIQAVIAEVQLSDTFEFGTEFGLQDALLFDRGSSTGGTLQSPVFNQGTILTNAGTSGQRQNVAGQGLTNFATGRSNTTLGYGGLVLSAASESVGILLRALQDANRLQILSRPQIMTMDNRPASVQVGSIVSRVQGTTASTFGNQVNVLDTKVGLILQVWPRVNEDGLIVMQVFAERSALGPEVNGTPVGFGANGDVIRAPAINTTNAQTTISAYSGQTVVFAGLIQKQRTDVSRRVPWLGDIPYLGRLFRFDSQTEVRSELLIVLTPRIVQTDEDYEVIKQVESSRMSYCLADILEMHGDVGLSGGHGFWGPARGPVIYPDMQPAAVENLGPGESIIEGPYMQPLSPQPMIDNAVPNVSPTPGVPGGPTESMIQAAPNMQPIGYQRPPAQASYRPTPGSANQVVPTSATMPVSTTPVSTPTSIPAGYRPATQANTVPAYQSTTPMRSMGVK